MGSAEEAVLLFETDPVHTHIPVSVRCVISASPKLGSKKYKSKNKSPRSCFFANFISHFISKS